ncbi:TAT-binding protein-like protein 7, AAA ATPase [Paecilomyces lecythidis]|uniref:TAT-binding protein-like protein 7, AAA ATPase n=1 Tax=Paecilomyces lecythidis TaxID=3004212 RepID=A0ABR3WW84_9EURO
MARVKRSIEEIVNKSDSEDEDYSDHDVRPSRSARSKSKSKKKSKPSKKRRRRDSDDDIVSDDDDFSEDEELSYHESEDEDNTNVERNAKGVPRRRAARNRPIYNEGESSSFDEDGENGGNEDDDDDEGAVGTTPPRSRTSKVVKLKLSAPVMSQFTRRSTRHNRDPSEGIYALTNSGHHVETIERGTHSPEPLSRPRRGGKSVRTKDAITEDEEDETKGQAADHEPKNSQLEIMESDAQGDFEEEPSLSKKEEDKADVEMADDGGFVPESENGDAKEGVQEEDDDDDDDEGPTTRRRSRPQRRTEEQQSEQETSHQSRSSRKKPSRSSQRRQKDDESDFEPEEDEDSNDEDELSVSGKSHGSPTKNQDDDDDTAGGRRPGLRKRKSQSRGQSEAGGDIAEELAEELESLRGDRPRRRAQPEIVYEKPRRSRKDVDYRIIRPDLVLPIEEAENEPSESPSRRGRGGGGGATWQRTLFSTYGPFGGGGPGAVLAPSGAPGATGGVESDSSDDEATQQPKAAAGPSAGGALLNPAQTHGDTQGLSGTPANLGKVKDKQALADADPLGVDPNVDFNSVGGLQGHIDQLKEMVTLPLLYPEIFQRFHIVPPRGVLFHGPPGTGKTLLARALASSVSSQGRKVTFYMRKGADALSKWVGEAERQLRLLFEEARKTQPSIIFFDEIDGLAPVRSSKQEQIHASIVSTLLALMDGMDGRGQVIVIGATNRPDSIDPALRRPGRFDREFYFPLPNKEGRRAILDIHTKGWDPPLPANVKDELAEITKGYGGADLRALCTEAALNAVQRRYPQIYQSTDKLLIDPKSIEVKPKDFMMSVKKIVPSSERSASSGASPLPKGVEPLLRRPLSEVEKLLSETLPQKKRLTALEEAQFEDAEHSGSFQREQMQQEFERSRVFRPRLLIRGSQGMGQQYLAAAILHHFEGLHVQPFDLATLISDSTRSPEAAVVQLFTEVKRHKPSVIYIPNVQTWFDTVGQTVVSTFLGLLRSVPPTDPVLVLGILEEDEREDIDPGFMKNLFGFSKKNIYRLGAPDNSARYEFFEKLIQYVKTPPAEFPDPENRKRRKLEPLQLAPPPPPPPPPALSKEQLKAQKKKDHQTLNFLKIRIQPIMDQIKKYKRFRTGVIDESQIRYLFEEDDPNIVTSDLPIEQRTTFRPFEKDFDKHGVPGLREAVSGKFYYNLEIVTIEKRLSNGYYKRPKDFLADIKRLAKDARQFGDQERMLRANELLSNVEVDIGTIEQTDPALVAECENVYLRELEREKAALEKAKKAEEEARGSLAPANASNVPHGNTDSSLSSGPVVLGEPFTNGQSNVPGRPVTPVRQSTVSFTNGYHRGGGSDLNDTANPSTSNGSASREGDGDVYMTNSEDAPSVGQDTQHSSFGPSAQPKPPHSYTAPSQQIRRQSGLSSLSQKGPMTPMAPGSQPGEYSNDADTTQTTSDKKTSDQSTGPTYHTQSPAAGSQNRMEYPDLTMYPDRVSQEEHLPDTQQGENSRLSAEETLLTGISEFANSQNGAPNGSQSQSSPQQSKWKAPYGSQQPPVPLFNAPAKQHSQQPPSDIQSLLNNEDTSFEFIIDNNFVDQLHQQLTQRTSGCSVEQLEQINTGLMDCIWRMRSEWDRTKVAGAVRDTFNEILDDMQAVQEFGPISQKTKEQMAMSRLHE